MSIANLDTISLISKRGISMEYDISNLLLYIDIPIDEIRNCIRYFLMRPMSFDSIKDINEYFAIKIESKEGNLIAKERTLESYGNLLICSSLPRKMSGMNKKITIRKEDIIRYKVLDTYEYFISYEDFYNKLKTFISPKGLEVLWNLYKDRMAKYPERTRVTFYTKKLSNTFKKLFNIGMIENENFENKEEVLYVNKDFIFVNKNGRITVPVSFEKGLVFFNRYLKNMIKGEQRI